MAIDGDASAWAGTFDSTLIPSILDLLFSAWHDFVKPAHDELEPHITRRFRNQLRATKNLVKLAVRIGREVVEDDLATGDEKGRIDIQFTSPQSCREDVYLAFECKKLNVIHNGEWASQASDYAKDGIMRFVTGQYADGLTDGGMIGYVMDGRIDKAVQSVSSQIKSRCIELQMPSPCDLRLSSLRPEHQQIKETTHSLIGRDLILHHIFLSAVHVPT